ncbi:MAG: arsenosugar biosynthesis radical SAM (seleno)protein ArsS [Planctomycetota bacterium]|jgi:radical SAM/Cys-rich protein
MFDVRRKEPAADGPAPLRLTVSEQVSRIAEAPVPSFQAHLEASGLPALRAGRTDILQVNVGKLCNQRCRHCHVDAGPHQVRANMAWPTFEACLRVTEILRPRTVDITGGAPELNPHFRRFVKAVKALRVPDVIDRCNLTVLLLEAEQDLAAFLAEHGVHIVASLPAPNPSQTDAQRGKGIFERSIRAMRRLNALGYGHEGTGLRLTLMSNPSGAFLPPPQSAAEQRFKSLLADRYGVVFNDLVELTNMPINRFLEYLIESGNYPSYMERLSAAFNPVAVRGLMCRNTLSVGWDGTLYDCDFNQMLELPVAPRDSGTIFDYARDRMEGRAVRVGRHCLGCTAGQGSSCSGATS